MTDHTKEPWAAHLNVPNATIKGHLIKAAHGAKTPIASLWVGGGTHGKESQEANASRIVSCVNALAGVADPAEFICACRDLVAAYRRVGLPIKEMATMDRVEKAFSGLPMDGRGVK